MKITKTVFPFLFIWIINFKFKNNNKGDYLCINENERCL